MNTRTLNNASQINMNMLQRFCRGQIFKQLLGLKNARLLIIEGEQEFAFGDPHANLHASIIVQDADIYPHLALGGSLGWQPWCSRSLHDRRLANARFNCINPRNGT